MNINEFHPTSGRFVKEDGATVNIADELGGKSVSDKVYDIDNMMPHSGRFIKEDGTCVNIADMIANGDIGGGGGSSDDSAPPIVETYNGQTIQCSMSADRPFKGLNLYATCEQATTTGAQLFDASLIPTTSRGGATVTNNGDGSFTISGEGQTTERFSVNRGVPKANITLKPGALSLNRESVVNGCRPYIYVQGQDSDGAVVFEITNLGEMSRTADIAEEMIGRIERYVFGFWSEANETITPTTFFPMVYQDGNGTYEPYTGGIPSPNGDYPQEIQSASDFVVEVKNSMGEDATPQTLNVVIPEQGFYGIPVETGGNYTDTDGQQWICDEFDYKRGKYIQRVRKVILNGNENEGWKHYGASPNKSIFVAFRTFEGTKGAFKTSICNMFINKAKMWDSDEAWIYSDHNNRPEKYFNIPKTTASTLDEWKTWLSTHPLEVLCSLATPVEYDLTNEQVEQFKKLRSYYGTTYIDNDAVPACNMQAELVLDTKLYIDNKLSS